MTKRMLIDATHPEETRVVVLNGNRIEEFDYETSTKKQIKGNIYLAKVTRVEPSLQAAFVEYGGNRHGFLAFNEIHPDYYRIPIADREAAIAADRDAEAAADRHEEEHGVSEQAAVEPVAAAEPPGGAGEEHAESGEDAGVLGDEDGADVERSGEVAGVQTACATKGEQSEVAGIEAALHADYTNGAFHVGVGDAEDSFSQ